MAYSSGGYIIFLRFFNEVALLGRPGWERKWMRGAQGSETRWRTRARL